ncbi:MAG: hypothetical protein MMC23_004222 [Stictis urceolatum]|nr:hypothetical protein [Stictis urceolata]
MTSKIWNDNAFDDYLEKLLIAGQAQNGWDRNKENPLDKSPLDVVLSHADHVADWYCHPSDPTNAHCTSELLGDDWRCKKTLTNDPAAVSILKAVANLANRVVSTAAETTDALKQVIAKEDELRDIFSHPCYRKDKKLGTGNWAIANGVLTIVQSAVGVIPHLGSRLSAAMGIALGANTPIFSRPWEPYFDEYMELQNTIEIMSEGIMQSLRHGANLSINQIPSSVKKENVEKWVKSQSALPHLLRDGKSKFASASSQSLTADQKRYMKGIIHSGAINHIWTINKSVVVRVERDDEWGIPHFWGKLCYPPDRAKSFPYPCTCGTDGKFGDGWGDHVHVLAPWNAGHASSSRGFEELYLDEDKKFGVNTFAITEESWVWHQLHPFKNIKDYPGDKISNLVDDTGGMNKGSAELWDLTVCNIRDAVDHKRAAKRNQLSSYAIEAMPDYPEEIGDIFKLHFYCRCGRIPNWPLGNRPDDSCGFGAWDYIRLCCDIHNFKVDGCA